MISVKERLVSKDTDMFCSSSIDGFGSTGHRKGYGSVLFTGPDGIRDYRAKVEEEHRYVGEGTMSPEGTSEAAYLWRSPQSTPHPRPKSVKVGEIGWGVPQLHPWFASSMTGAQLMLGEFRQAAEDRHTHLHQNAWYPGPKDHNQKLLHSSVRAKSGARPFGTSVVASNSPGKSAEELYQATDRPLSSAKRVRIGSGLAQSGTERVQVRSGSARSNEERRHSVASVTSKKSDSSAN